MTNDQQSSRSCRTLMRDLLPLAEAYLKAAPGHPANAILEEARAFLNEPSTGESPKASRQRGEGSPFTTAERNALRKAAGFALSGEWPFHNIKRETLERAQEKL